MAVPAGAGPASDEDRSIPWRSPTLHVVIATMLVGVMGVSLVAPVLPTIQDTFDVTGTEVGLVLTVFALPGIVLAPLAGVLADRFGRRPVLIPGLLLFGLAGSAIAFVTDFRTLLLFRFFQGIGGSAVTTLAITLIGDSWDGVRRNAVMGITSTGLSVGTSTYPLVGGLLAGIAWNVPFGLFVLGALMGVVAFRVLEEPTIESGDESIGYIRDAIESVSLRTSVLLYGFTFLVFVTVFGALLTLVPLLLAEGYGLSSSYIGLVLTGGAITSGLVASQNGRLATYFTNVELIGFGFAIYGTSLLAIGLFFGQAPAAAIAAAVVLFGAGSGLAIPSINTAVTSFIPDRLRGGAVSLRTSFIRAGETVGPVVFPLGASVFGYRPVLLASGGLLLALGVTVWIRRDAEFAETPA